MERMSEEDLSVELGTRIGEFLRDISSHSSVPLLGFGVNGMVDLSDRLIDYNRLMRERYHLSFSGGFDHLGLTFERRF